MSEKETNRFNLQSLKIPEEKREELLRIFPEVRTEGGQIDLNRLRLALGDMVDTGKERYGLNWPGKSACFKAIQTPSMGTLLPAPEESVNFETTENLIIEGDNLEALKLLQKSYIGKVKMIYIDPPYNTGNDFIYPDNYSESLQTYLEYTGQTGEEGKRFSSNTDTDGRFHSKWLNMMYPRLYLARDLLRDDGVIFISVDDHEIDNLLKLGQEVFGSENFIANLIWQHSVQPKGYSGKFSVHHNFVVCFQKSDAFELHDLERTNEHNKNYSNPDGDPNGPWRSGDVRNALYRKNLIYDIATPSGSFIKPPANGWRWSSDTLQKKIKSGEIIFSPDHKRIVRKIYLNTLDGRTPETIMFGKDVGTTRDAAEENKGLFHGESPFETPKPSRLVKHLIGLAGANEGDTILDFFAGSGTTAHAVLDLNKQDGGNRKFILIQLPEPTDRTDYPTIADITKERVRRVIKKLNDEDGNEKNQDRGFRVFKLAESNFTPWDGSIDQTPEDLSKQIEMHIEHVRQGRTDQDILYEILLKSGFPLSVPVETLQVDGKTVYSIYDGIMLVCLDRNLSMPSVQAIVDRLPERVVFLDEGFAGNDALKVNAKEACKLKNIVFKVV
ncbi:site-specific DNA-methyltransferase [Acidithiobacillus thiooxidans]|uniref:site-specific DNA-methyltransferase n=1 Tax=Acidithiobacillus thiooxidans TaxID=930 RepID=UPI001B301FEF|nr:site-specific DNA-methyltransferase [Acidithiobacillus thiooxidans]MDX5933824.1 site-specific DNA-methyltransferase [Acidithiobacillus thiooxidans]